MVGGRTPDRGDQISILVAKNPKLEAFMFMSMDDCSKADDTRPVNSTSMLQYQHQWELEEKKKMTLGNKVDKNN